MGVTINNESTTAQPPPENGYQPNSTISHWMSLMHFTGRPIFFCC